MKHKENAINIKAAAILGYYPVLVTALSDQFFISDISHRTNMEYPEYPISLDVDIITFCIKGTLDISIGHNSYTLHENDFILIPSTKVLQLSHKSENFNAVSLYVKPGFFAVNHDTKSLETRAILIEHPCHHLTPEKMEHILSLINYLKQILQDSTHIYLKQIVLNALETLFYEISNSLLKEKKNESSDSTSGKEVLKKFIKDIENHFRKERTITFYAEKACLTPKYFSMLIHRQTGKHAKKWIDGYTIMEAKAMLKSTHLSIQQISYELNFATPSHFGRYFKHHTNLSPRQYRKQ